MPVDALGLPQQLNKSRLRIVWRRRALRHAAQFATARRYLMLVGVAAGAPAIGSAGANAGEVQWVGSGEAKGPRRADGCQKLHQHRKHDDWKKSSQSPLHRRTAFPFVS